MSHILCKNMYGQEILVPTEKLKFRPSVYGLIVHDGNILLGVNRTNGKMWFPGGGIELGEPILDALHREIQEEVGMQVTVEQCVYWNDSFFYYDPEDLAMHVFSFFYLCRPINPHINHDHVIQDEEVTQSQWMPLEDLTTDHFNHMKPELLALLKQLS